MGRRNTWRKMNLFFQKDIGLGTRFDFLPLEVLKIIFDFKVVGDQENRKKRRKENKRERKIEKRERQRKAMEDQRKRYAIELAQRRSEQRIRDTWSLYNRFGVKSWGFDESERICALAQIREEDYQRQRERSAQFHRETLQRIQSRPGGGCNPYNFYAKMQGGMFK